MMPITEEVHAFLMANAAAQIQRDDEYLDPADGLLHCKTCHGLRQTVIPAPGGTGFLRPRCLCPCQSAAEKQCKAAEEKRERLERMQKRKAELDAIFKKLYEDSVLGRITAEQFQMLSASYTDEQAKLTESLPQQEAEIQRLKETVSNTAAFLDKAKRYTDIQELTPELLRLFIQKIVVHEKEVKWSKHAPQTVEIHYADIGCMENRQTAKPEQHKDIPMVS